MREKLLKLREKAYWLMQLWKTCGHQETCHCRNGEP